MENKKYEFIQVDNDYMKLKYKDQEYQFKVNVKLEKDIQSVIKDSRLKLIDDLSDKNKTLNDYVKVRKENGKTYYDNSLKEELEQIYERQAQLEFFQNFSQKTFGKELEELIHDIEIADNEEEMQKFIEDLGYAIMGKIPSK